MAYAEGDVRVYLGSIRSGALAALAALAMAGVLGGCADFGWDSGTLFRKPVDVVGRSGGYTYSDLQESRQARPVTDSDLVDANGGCPLSAAPPAARGQTARPAAPRSDALAMGGGGRLGMPQSAVGAR